MTRDELKRALCRMPLATALYWCWREPACSRCLGCANRTGGLTEAGVSKEQWLVAINELFDTYAAMVPLSDPMELYRALHSEIVRDPYRPVRIGGVGFPATVDSSVTMPSTLEFLDYNFTPRFAGAPETVRPTFTNVARRRR
jgi:hypothetical protein